MFENEFNGKVVLVTGGSRGIGFAAVKGFLPQVQRSISSATMKRPAQRHWPRSRRSTPITKS